MAITHPTDPRIKGLAAALLETDIPSWEFDLRTVEPGTDPPDERCEQSESGVG